MAIELLPGHVRLDHSESRIAAALIEHQFGGKTATSACQIGLYSRIRPIGAYFLCVCKCRLSARFDTEANAAPAPPRSRRHLNAIFEWLRCGGVTQLLWQSWRWRGICAAVSLALCRGTPAGRLLWREDSRQGPLNPHRPVLKKTSIVSRTQSSLGEVRQPCHLSFTEAGDTAHRKAREQT